MPLEPVLVDTGMSLKTFDGITMSLMLDLECHIYCAAVCFCYRYRGLDNGRSIQPVMTVCSVECRSIAQICVVR